MTAAGAEAFRAFTSATPSGESPLPLGGIDIRLRDGTIRDCLIKTVRIEDTGMPGIPVRDHRYHRAEGSGGCTLPDE